MPISGKQKCNKLCRCTHQNHRVPSSINSVCSAWTFFCSSSSRQISRSTFITQNHRISLASLQWIYYSPIRTYPPLNLFSLIQMVWFEVTQVMSLIYTFQCAWPRYKRLFSVHAVNWYAKTSVRFTKVYYVFILCAFFMLQFIPDRRAQKTK